MVTPPDDSDKGEAFLRTLTEHERWLSAYVYTLIARPADADDIVQECKAVRWKQFSSFETGTNFRAWARTIALHQVLNFRPLGETPPYSTQDAAFIEAIAAEVERRSDPFDRKADGLKLCLRKLPEAHRALVLWRYYENNDVEEIAVKSGRTATPASGDDGLRPDQTRRLAEFWLPRGASGAPFSVRSPEIASFLKNDTNGIASFVIVRETSETDPSGRVHAFASKEHPSARPPRCASAELVSVSR